MDMLHVSALPIWPLKGNVKMPSLRERILGRIRSGLPLDSVMFETKLLEEDRPDAPCAR